MKQEALLQFGHPNLILLGFLLFLGCFLGVLVWTLMKSNRTHFEKMAKLPLTAASRE